jgi:branched-chain amino acid transport system ATP-binding protein
MPDAPALEVAGLSVSYGGVPAVTNVSFELAAGEIVGLIGPNGAGKSTTLHAVMGVCQADHGDVRLGGRSILGAKPEAIARAGIALVPEGRRIYADFTVEENLRLGLVAATEADGAAEQLAWIKELFPVVHDFRGRQAGALSGGQQQQLAIARALAARPRVLLLDEPSLGLAPKVVDVVFDALARIRDHGVAVLLVEQRAQRTVAIANRSHVLANGVVRMTLGPADADDTERIVAAYLA